MKVTVKHLFLELFKKRYIRKQGHKPKLKQKTKKAMDHIPTWIIGYIILSTVEEQSNYHGF